MAEQFEGNANFSGREHLNQALAAFKPSRDLSWEAMIERLKNERGAEVVDLWERGTAPNFHEEYHQKAPSLVLYPPHGGTARGAFVIAAGGGHVYKSWNEAEPVADYFYSKGFYTAILDYRVDPYNELDSVADGHRAICYLRAYAEQYNIDPSHIAIGGFSAGGMLANQAATMYSPGDPMAADPLKRISSRPDATILGYGAFTRVLNDWTIFHDPEKQRALARTAPEVLLTPDCPPYFMFQTATDDPRCIAHLATRLTEVGVPFEAHIFMGGVHGNGLFDGKNEVQDVPHTAHWAKLCAEWLTGQGFTN